MSAPTSTGPCRRSPAARWCPRIIEGVGGPAEAGTPTPNLRLLLPRSRQGYGEQLDVLDPEGAGAADQEFDPRPVGHLTLVEGERRLESGPVPTVAQRLRQVLRQELLVVQKRQQAQVRRAGEPGRLHRGPQGQLTVLGGEL